MAVENTRIQRWERVRKQPAPQLLARQQRRCIHNSAARPFADGSTSCTRSSACSLCTSDMANLHQARQLLLSIGTGSLIERCLHFLKLCPQPSDFDLVFTREAAAIARERYQNFWSDPPLPTWATDQTELSMVVYRPHNLQGASGTARYFAATYETIAHILQPDRTWLSWKRCAPGEVHGTVFDGLVAVNGRWIWLPKPWLLLSHFEHRAFEHWAA